MKKIVSHIFITFFSLSYAFADVQKPSIESAILEKIKKSDPVCATCNFIIQKKDSQWLKKHDFYEVTTFDILPPPAWHIAVVGNSIFFLDRRKIDDWNKVVSNEKLKLESDEWVFGYVKFFLVMTMNQSEFIDKLTQSEINRIEAKEKKKIESENKIVRTGDKIQVLFYANDTQGDLQQWNLVLKNNGEILKIQERSF